VWLHPAAWGFRKLLRYVAARYRSPLIYVTENGVSLHADTPSDGQYDVVRRRPDSSFCQMRQTVSSCSPA
jgi:hypothetical protein